MQFGKTQTTTITDDEGSTMTKELTYSEGMTIKPIRLRYEIRHRTDKTDLESLAKIAHALINDFSKLDAELKLERTKHGELQGYYHIVECYTVLEY